MKEILQRLIDTLFDGAPKEQESEYQSHKPVRVFWQKPVCQNNPLEPPKGDRSIAGLRVTPGWIEEMDDNEVFVFGSNTRGVHDGGASFTAVQYFGAILGQAEGIQGKSYAIPTDGTTLDEIQAAVKRFILFARSHPHLTFLVTEIGCGTAGYHPMEIAPMFIDAVSVPNIYLPKLFWKYITN